MYLTTHYTERLLMRPLIKEDEAMWKLFFNDKESHRFFTFDPSLPTEELSRQWIERQLKRYEENSYGLFAVLDKESGTFIGQAGLIMQDIENTKMLEAGYHIFPEYRGKGLATEAARYFKEFAFRNKLSDTVLSIIHIDNVRSQKVAEKNGMHRERQIEFRGLPFYIYRINSSK